MDDGPRDVVERIVADFSSRALPALTPREVRLPSVPGKVDAVAGMRRSGKTYLLFQRLRELERQGVGRERTLCVNFEDERLLPLKAEELGRGKATERTVDPWLEESPCAARASLPF